MSPGTPHTEAGVSQSPETTPATRTTAPYVVLTGNPNCGKTTLFNALTGLRAKVGNYAGVTVERKEGRLLGAAAGSEIKVLDLPGTYSLSPQSLDEQISRDVLLNRLTELPAPSLVVVVADASNLQRNLYYATQIIELGYLTVVALNMVDVAEANGHDIDVEKLARALGVPVLPIVASSGQGVPALRQQIFESLKNKTSPANPRQFCELPATFSTEVAAISELLAKQFHERRQQATAEAQLILSNEKAVASSAQHYPAAILLAVEAARKRLETAGVEWSSAAIEARYASVTAIHENAVTETHSHEESFSDKVDRLVTHKIWGTLIFVAIMALMFQSIFSFAKWPMDALQNTVAAFGDFVGGAIPPGELNSLLVGGVIAGVGAVVVFLPQILLLFFFIGLLEDTGYMARAAFLMDRLMSKVGLHGKSFIPMLSSFACAIPGIMATRTIESPKDRLVTILVAPLMSCSARLPVYTLLIAACIPDIRVLGIFKLAGIMMLIMYLLGIIVALLMAWLFKKTLLKGETPMLIMELPPYKRPLVRIVLRHMWDRSRLFLRRAGTVILGINILLWFVATYPKNSTQEKQFIAERHDAIASYYHNAGTTPAADAEIDSKLAAALAKPGAETNSPAEFALDQRLREIDKERAGEQLRYSFAGHMGRLIEPVIRPLGYDWKIGIGVITSFAAREVFVSTMSTVYNLGEGQDSEAITPSLAKTLRQQKRADGTLVYTPLTAISLMVFYVFALQCVSTVAIVRRETNSWKWPIFQWLYMAALAWGLAFITYQGGRLLGWS
ncbi:MAG TPA: ferrous iron transport protein B [Verrucomicrobiae bacterium]|jgi:ferrous iron transport protein B|nr:ferrous iron transport protein B [Verrucomicrobiae bacterium]